VGNEIMYYDDAEDWCRGLGRELTSVLDEQQQVEVAEMCQKVALPGDEICDEWDNCDMVGCWIGLDYVGTVPFWRAYTWEDGSAVGDTYGFDYYASTDNGPDGGVPTAGVSPWAPTEPRDSGAVCLDPNRDYLWAFAGNPRLADEAIGNKNFPICGPETSRLDMQFALDAIEVGAAQRLLVNEPLVLLMVAAGVVVMILGVAFFLCGGKDKDVYEFDEL